MLMITFPSTTLLWLLGALLAALVAGSVARFASLRNADEADISDRPKEALSVAEKSACHEGVV